MNSSLHRFFVWGVLSLTLFSVLSQAAAAGESCVVDDDCDYAHVCNDEECIHKDLSPFSALDIVGFIVTLLFSLLANSAGVGGGVFFVPIYILLLSFDTKVAVALSNATICPALILRFLLAYKRRHPEKNAPLINYDVAVIFSPCIILGTTVGVLANKVLPNIVLVVLIVIILGATAFKTFKTGFRLFKKEQKIPAGYETTVQKSDRKVEESIQATTHNRSHAVESINVGLDSEPNELRTHNPHDDEHHDEHEHSAITAPGKKVSQDEEALQKIEAYMSKYIQWDKFLFISSGVVFLFILTLLRGSKGTSSPVGVPSCSPGYWLLWFTFTPIAIIMTYLAMKRVSKEYTAKESAGYHFTQSDRQYDAKTCFNLAKIGFFTGTTSGILGVGGSVFTGPMMLSLGFQPEVSSYTATFLGMFTSVSSTLQYVMIGTIPMTYAAVVAPLSVIGCFLGVHVVGNYIKKSGHASYVVFLLASCIVIACLLVVLIGVLNVVDQVADDKNVLEFSSVC
eukprot:CAMPEP_0115029486 /NCGR_PEP_ID=MMETSP0216-20121206/37031_1 /TAXON_ID=223996 /ORGANISM="Protocruzia adherens, Strain Boccale" /LENGTH=509 /DNA_ID=CAMNT_0002406083 /DNA_START=211 /DNA_END=1740 /DNA_ORIENTATION=+